MERPLSRTSRSPGSIPSAAPAGSSITTFAPRAAAVRHGLRLRTTFTTRRSRLQNTASIGKRMKNMWIDPVCGKSIPSPASSDDRPSRPFSRASGVDATAHSVHRTVPSSLRN